MSLTDEDKTWITEQLRGYLREDRAWTTEQLRDTNSRITEYLREDRNRIMEEIRTVETSLLTEFHKWASPSEARQRTHAAALRAIDLEMEALSERVSKLEGK
jgi:hypothetical protein